MIEENNYYPFGMKHHGCNSNPTSSNIALKRKYNGIEYEDALGLNLYEMDVRSYDPAIARFTSIDPVTHHSMSTYTAFDNNPVFWADPSGADSIGADGLTNDQWIELSRPGGGGFDAMREQRNVNNFEQSSIINVEFTKGNPDKSVRQKKGFQPIDFENDNPKTIYEKLVKNISHYIKLRNKAIAEGKQTDIYVTDFFKNTLSAADMEGFRILKDDIKYNGGSIEFVVNFGENERVSGYFPDVTDRYAGGKLYKSFELQILGSGRSKVANDNNRTHINPWLIRIMFTDIELYNKFIKEINESVKQ